MALSIFKNRGIKAAQQRAKADYIKAASLPEEDRGARAIRLRMANRCKANLDKAFVEGAQRTALFQKQSVAALTKGSEKPVAPVANSYQRVKTALQFLRDEVEAEVIDKSEPEDNENDLKDDDNVQDEI